MDNVEIQLRTRELIPADHERETLFEALRYYQERQDLPRLLSELRLLLNEPQRLDLYDVMRPLILPCHQQEYGRRAPGSMNQRLRPVRLERRAGDSFGFAVKGGFEHGVGVYVTEVTPGLQAHRQGLKVGDKIVRINGFSIAEAIHADVLNLIRMLQDIVLKVTHVGMVPVKDNPSDFVTWEYVDEPMEDDTEEIPKELKLFVDTSGHDSFGCGIRSGPRDYPGIFIERVREGSIADVIGLESGDQILEVNGTIFKGISHNEAVQELKSSRQLNLVICKKRGLKLFTYLRETANRTQTSARPLSNQELGKHLDEMANLADSPAAKSPVTLERQSASHLVRNQQNDLTPDITSLISGGNQTISDKLANSNRTALHTSAEIHTENPVPNGGGSNSVTGTFDWTDTVSAKVYSKFNIEDINGRVLKSLTYNKNNDLGIEIEGGIGSPLGGIIQVAHIQEGSIADQCGQIQPGDQLMMISGHRLIGVTSFEAEMALKNTRGLKDHLELIYCSSNILNEEDHVTYF